MTKGLPLFILICALASVPLYSRTLGQLAVGALAVLYLLTLTSIKQASSAGRSSRGEAVQTNRERDQSAF